MIKNIKRSVVLVSIFTAFTSFSQETPKIGVPENFRNSTSIGTTNTADIKWKDFFAESDLVKLIEGALVKNNDLQIADKNMAIANLQFKQTKWGNVPELNAFATASSNRLSDNSLNGISTSQFLGRKHLEDYSAGISLSWEADIWGKIKNKKKSALAGYMQTTEAKKALQTAVVANVSKGFYDLLMLDAQLEIAKKTLILNDSTLFIVNLQYEAGQVNLFAKQQTEAQQLVAAQLIPQLEQNIQVQENALSVLTGTFPEAKERESKLETIIVKENLSAGIPSQLLSKRPDVKSAEMAVRMANARVGVTKASLYPSLNITARTGINSFEINNWFNIPASLFGSIAGGLTAPLLNSKKLKTQYKITKVEREQAILQFKQTVLVAVGEVSNALTKIEKQEAQFEIAKHRVTTLQKAIINVNMLFKNGMATYLEVIIAQGNLLQAELELASIKKERLSSNVELYRALGGGWE
ncbi:NodT family efflux transporter outer membrane factor (OMF) lipoprotein [Tenacibaculum adriaticum]|uniref:NodT family efflux transporter outer membrane factor (OMF) lipoprotein n=1 Tax=Tenacibaculum adriaticum TaxID=413713 RepID=A0A5S5DST3_9FLAO|nr:efflux transporter outer membrane subunit [Tenacibaculum adriaticum]TYP98951.1 NodT family efflux transporter outer membrane factor (OMF) lipoprotein [Tenacibaculum adriaticum]